MSVADNPNGHNYSSNNFLVSRPYTGFRQDGSTGNSFPSSDTSCWIPASPEKVEELADKYIRLLQSGGDTEWSDFMRSIKPFMESFVDFDPLGI